MRIQALGALALPGHTFHRPKPLLVGTYLCVQGPASRRRLAELFWPDASDARDSLSTTLRRLNRLGPDPLLSSGDPVEPLVECDAVEFLAAMSAGEHERALQLYGGRFLAGFDLPVGEEVEEWIYATAEQLAYLARQAHLALAHSARERRDLPLASHHAEAALDLERSLEWEDDQLVAVMEHLHAAGNPRSREARELAQTLGVAYSLHGAFSADTGGGVSIPRPGTSFVGREAELSEVGTILFSGVARLLTLHGPGGVGKSRFASEVALRAATGNLYPGAIYFVQLEAITNDEMITSAVATAMRLVLPPAGDPREHIIRVIGSRPMLIIFDNFEHVMNSAAFVAAILRSCPNVDIIVTSRVTLGLSEEHVMVMNGLRVDGPTGESEALQLLFARMRQHGTLGRITADDELAAHDICLKVDGSPLAIELAAAQTQLIPLQEVLLELRSGMGVLVNTDPTAPERQRSLHAALDVSWNLLQEGDGQALAELSVFCGGFTRHDCGVIANVDTAALRRLVEASLLRVLPGGRFELHPIVKQYSAARLAENTVREAALTRRHAQHYLGSLAARDYHILTGANALELSAWIEEEFPNLEAALAWCVNSGELSGFEAVALPLSHFAELHGRFGDVVRLLETGVTASHDLGRAGGRSGLTNTLGALPFAYFRLGRYHDAIETGWRALEVAAAIDTEASDWAVWAARQGMALSSVVLGLFEQARELATSNVEERVVAPADAAITDRRRSIVDITVGTSLQTLWLMDLHVGEFDTALARLERALELFEAFRAPYLGYIYCSLGETHRVLGNLDEAQAMLERGLEVAYETGFRNQVGHLLSELVLVHLLRSDTRRADALARKALEVALNGGDKWLEATVRSRWGLVALQQGALSGARERLLTALEVASAANAYGFAMEAVLGMAELHAKEQRPTDAALLLSFVQACALAGAVITAQATRQLEPIVPLLEPGELDEVQRVARALSPADAFSSAIASAD